MKEIEQGIIDLSKPASGLELVLRCEPSPLVNDLATVPLGPVTNYSEKYNECSHHMISQTCLRNEAWFLYSKNILKTHSFSGIIYICSQTSSSMLIQMCVCVCVHMHI